MVKTCFQIIEPKKFQILSNQNIIKNTHVQTVFAQKLSSLAMFCHFWSKIAWKQLLLVAINFCNTYNPITIVKQSQILILITNKCHFLGNQTILNIEQFVWFFRTHNFWAVKTLFLVYTKIVDISKILLWLFYRGTYYESKSLFWSKHLFHVELCHMNK